MWVTFTGYGDISPLCFPAKDSIEGFSLQLESHSKKPRLSFSSGMFDFILAGDLCNVLTTMYGRSFKRDAVEGYRMQKR